MLNFFIKRIGRYSVFLSLGLGLILSTTQIFQSINSDLLSNNVFFDSPYTKWLSIDSFNFSSTIFFILLPLIASLPASIMIKEDLDSGLIHQLKITNSFNHLLSGYYISSFLGGFVVIFIPLFTNFFIYFTLLPNIYPDNFINNNILVISQNTLFVNLYYTQPFLHALFSILFASFYGGLFSLLASVNSLRLKNKFVALMSSFFLQIILLILNTFITLPNHESIVPADFIKETANSTVSLTVTLSITTVLIIYVTLMILGGKKKIVW